MSIFAKIQTIDDMLPHIAGKEYIGVMKKENGATVVCYNISNGESFTNAYEKEARGITFDRDGKIISRPLHKFFNLAERAEVQPNVLPWDTMTAVFDKMDGSMISTGFFHGEFFTKSKKAFESDVSVSAYAFVKRNPKYYEFAKYCAEAGLTPIFEFTSPKHRIVLNYREEGMTLLHVRDTVTGIYMPAAELALKFGIPYNMPLYGKEVDMQELLKSLNTAKDIEGYVIQFANGEMVKVKTKWYMDLHHAVTFVRERDIARLVVEEKIDDYVAFLRLNAPDVDLTQVNYIIDTIKSQVETLQHEVDVIAASYEGKSFKEIALDLKGHKYFGFVMCQVRGKVNNYLDYYASERLSDWSLEQIDLGDLGDMKQEDAG